MPWKECHVMDERWLRRRHPRGCPLGGGDLNYLFRTPPR